MLQLFFPYRSIEKFKSKRSYEEFYHSPGVKETVERNRSLFEKDTDALERAEEILENDGIRDSAWSQICPETEVNRLECITEKEAEKKRRHRIGITNS